MSRQDQQGRAETPDEGPSGARRELEEQDLSAAIRDLVAALQGEPDSPRLLCALAEAYQRGGRTLDALRQLDRIIDLGAATAATWKQTGQLLASVGEFAQALGAYQRSIELDGADAEARHDCGRVLYKLGDLAGAVEQLEKATELCDELAPWQALAIAAPGHLGYDQADVSRIRRTFATHLARYSGSPADVPHILAASGRLRIGYLSSWFDRQNYMKPVWGLINQHDRTQFEIHLFSDAGVEQGLPGFRPRKGDHVHQTRHLDNESLVDAIRRAGIDILVDLNAYSTPERLGLFLSHPAPVTVAWFNMYATSGLPGFDYIVGDDVTVRPDEEVHYCEKVLRLPQSYLSFTVTHDAPPIVDPPCGQREYITFGSLAPLYKMVAPVLDAWGAILQAVGTARLLLANTALDSACNRDYVATRLSTRGIEPARVEFRGRADHRAFLEYYNEIDIALDTFPYNGGTTTMEAIWQGVPVVTFVGDRWVSRTSASIVTGTPCAEFVAADEASYVQTAVALADDPRIAQRLQRLRHTMRASLSDCAVCDTRAFAKAMEALYRKIARRA